MKNSKILFTDLDGTLLTDDKKITPKTRQALDAWTEAGHKLVLCSGRPLLSIRLTKEELSLRYPGMYLIGFNGGVICEADTQKVLSRTVLTPAQASRLLREAADAGIHCQTYGEDIILTPSLSHELQSYRRTIHVPYQVVEDLPGALLNGSLQQNGESAHEGLYKCLAICEDPQRLEAFRQALKPYACACGISLVYSNSRLLEMFPDTSGKGAAVKTLCGLLRIPVESAVAAGDQGNDISMLTAAGTGIAMLNGTADVKNAADLITSYDNNHDGLAEVLFSLL